MISETDIQIGDWLHLEYTNSINGFVSFNFKVSQLRRDYGDELLVWGEKTPDGKHFGNMGGISKIQPIPLTPEILEKNGFRLVGEKFIFGEIDDDLVELNLSINNSYRIHISVADLMIGHSGWIEYVHQLQHALRLCGISKEIVL